MNETTGGKGMKGKQRVRGSIAVVLAAMLVVMAGCSSKTTTDPSSTPLASTPASTAAAETIAPTAAPQVKTPITLNVEFNATGPDFEQTEVYNEIVKQTGVTMKIELYDPKKFQVEMAGGDLPDIIQVPNSGDQMYLKQLVDGNNIIPLDDLVNTNGPDIQKPVYAKSLEYSKKFWSGDTGKLYVIPMQIGPAGWGYDQQNGINLRWDYYKELGYPVMKNIDDIVNVIDQMVKKHPTTADGKKVYGVSIWNDWGTWGLASMGLVTGHNAVTTDKMQVFNNYTDTANSSIWDTAEFLYKAKQKGILDPDGFVNKYDDLVAKSSQGTILSSIATWQFKDANAELLKQGPDKGFVTIPLDWGSVWVGGTTVAGWNSRAFAISKNCKDPQRAMDLINFLVSEQGSRLIESGIQGVHWDMVDGKPQINAATLALKAAGGDPWKKTGINMAANQQGLTDASVISDGSVVNLFTTTEAYAARMNSLEKDYSAHYGVAYPAAAYKKYADEGKVKTNDQTPQDILAAMAAPDDDIKLTQAKLDDLVIKGIPQIVLKSKTDADYKAGQAALIKKLNDAGAEKWFAWYQKAFADAKAKF
jgi:putative aldouronate transport system substrate-binding protein